MEYQTQRRAFTKRKLQKKEKNNRTVAWNYTKWNKEKNEEKRNWYGMSLVIFHLFTLIINRQTHSRAHKTQTHRNLLSTRYQNNAWIIFGAERKNEISFKPFVTRITQKLSAHRHTQHTHQQHFGCKTKQRAENKNQHIQKT